MDWSVVDSVRALSANDGLTFKIRSRIARKVSGEDVISEKWPFDDYTSTELVLQNIQADITVTHLWKKRGWTACRRPRPNLSILKKLTRSIVSFIFRILWNIRIWWSDKNKNWHRWLVHTDYLRARNWFDSKKGKQLWQGKGWKQVFFQKDRIIRLQENYEDGAEFLLSPERGLFDVRLVSPLLPNHQLLHFQYYLSGLALKYFC